MDSVQDGFIPLSVLGKIMTMEGRGKVHNKHYRENRLIWTFVQVRNQNIGGQLNVHVYHKLQKFHIKICWVFF